MTFQDFIAQHRSVEGFDNPRDDDFCILHAIELARRHPDAETTADLLRAARRELRVAQLPFAVQDMLLRLRSLYDLALMTGMDLEIVRPARRGIGLEN